MVFAAAAVAELPFGRPAAAVVAPAVGRPAAGVAVLVVALDPLESAVVCPADGRGIASRRLSALVKGATPAPAVTLAFRKFRRFNTMLRMVFQASLLAVRGEDWPLIAEGDVAHPLRSRRGRDRNVTGGSHSRCERSVCGVLKTEIDAGRK